MKTNYEMIYELNESFTPEQRHITTIKEINYINKTLELDDRDILDLRNLRDMVVMFLDNEYMRKFISAESGTDVSIINIMDKMSAITNVIDLKISNLGGEV